MIVLLVTLEVYITSALKPIYCPRLSVVPKICFSVYKSSLILIWHLILINLCCPLNFDSWTWKSIMFIILYKILLYSLSFVYLMATNYLNFLQQQQKRRNSVMCWQALRKKELFSISLWSILVFLTSIRLHSTFVKQFL